MANGDAFAEIFRRLRSILARQVPPLVVTEDGQRDYSLAVDRPEIQPEARRYFGGVNVRKNYVSYYLIGVYADPRLVESLSPGLRKRMQGKSCFNFNKVDEDLFAELSALTDKAAKRYPEVVDLFLAGKL
ncbi:MAG: hypothetical protein M3Z98_10025 [Candidatus Dormibacteraeota bacterium]|nr:hypothetical protein [Candidatus Dormibacteraeota bacterium]